MAMTLVSTVTVGSGGAAEINFTSIPQTGKDLVVLLSGRSTETGLNPARFFIQINDQGSSTYLLRRLQGNGSAASSGNTSQPNVFFFDESMNSATSTASTFSNISIYFSNYTIVQSKNIAVDGVTEANATTAWQSLFAGNLADTAAITKIRLTTNSNFAQHTTASLYIIS